MVNPSRLITHVAEMIAAEAALETRLDELARRSQDFGVASQLLQELQSMAAAQFNALQLRYGEIGGSGPRSDESTPTNPEGLQDYPVTSALSHASGDINRAIAGYAILRSIALRHRDSSLIGEGNTGDLAERHMKNYVGALHRISQVLHNAVLWELDRDNSECQCTCPSCSIGICMCAQGPRRTLSDIWADAGPICNETAVYVHTPRRGSAAEVAGLRPGDTILKADGKELETHFVLQEIVGGHAHGENIELSVERVSGDIEMVTIVRH